MPLDTEASFTVSAFAQAAATPTGPVALFSAPGTNKDALSLRYIPSATGGAGSGRWRITTAETDKTDAVSGEVENGQFYGPEEWTHLALVYDGFAHEMRLYVNGELEEVACQDANEDGEPDVAGCTDQVSSAENVLTFKAVQSLQLGRDRAGGYWSGSVSDVRDAAPRGRGTGVAGRPGVDPPGHSGGTAQRRGQGGQRACRAGTVSAPGPDTSRPPVPVVGCATCAELAACREASCTTFDRSAETDANVLMRRHQRQDHRQRQERPEAPRTTRRTFRYVPFTIVQDVTAEPEYATRCVSGDESECGAESGVRGHPADVEEWQRRHTQETRHTRYRRTFADYAVMEPPSGVASGLPADLEPVRVARARTP